MYTYSCKVVNIVDGDTIDVELDLGFHIKMKERVRLIDVDTPEVYGRNAVPEGVVASDFVKRWIEERVARGTFVYESVKYNSKDKYGRSLGYLRWLSNTGTSEVLNEAIIAAGFIKQ